MNGLKDQIDSASKKSEARAINSDNINIETLPSYIRNFIRLQHEASGRDVGQIDFMISPSGITSLSQNGTKHVEKEKRKLRQWWYEFLMTQLKTMSEMFVRTWEKIEIAEAALDKFEEQLENQLEDGDFNNASSGVKEDIKSFRKDLKQYKKQLTNKPEPNAKDLQAIQDNVDSRLDRIKENFKNAKEICKHAGKLFANSSIAAFFKSKGLFRSQSLEADFSSAYEAPTKSTEPYVTEAVTNSKTMQLESVADNE